MKNIFSQNKFLLLAAPMEDVTDSVFRNLCHKYGADLTFTEMTRIESLARNNKSTWDKIVITDNTPTEIQLAGAKEASLKKFLSQYEPVPGFNGINFNLGCPSPEIIRLGYGCAMIKRISKVRKLVGIVHDSGYSCSLKMRLGLNKFEREKKIYINLIDAVDAEHFIVHARHGAQHYEEPADFLVYKECVKLGKPIIANGDICSAEQIQLLKSFGVKGAMIGRAAVRDIAIFDRLNGKEAPSTEEIKKEYVVLAEQSNSRFKYRENVLKRLGKEPQVENEKESG